MSKTRSNHHTPGRHRHLLDALKHSNIKRLNEVIQKCDRCILNRKLRYEVNGQQRLFSPILAAVDLSSTAIVKFLLSKGKSSDFKKSRVMLYTIHLNMIYHTT
ncbi:hypothetical protein LSH36_547g05025, partial [Paralvinella palmiformis]